MEKHQIEAIKRSYPAGTRVAIDNMRGEAQMPQGLQGVVEFVDDAGQIHVAWDNGSALALIPGEDSFRKIGPEIMPASPIPFYRYTREEAAHLRQLDAWRESHRENNACKAYNDSAETGLSATAYRDNIVDGDGAYAKQLIERFGYRRCMHILACTIYRMSYDGRFSRDNKAWAERLVGWLDKERCRDYVLSTHPCLTDVLARNVRAAYDALGLYTAEQCIPDSGVNMEYGNMVLVVSPEHLNEAYWQPANQIFLARSGFGCSPTSSGRAVYGTYLIDGEETRRNREDFIGVIKDECIPDWAREKMEQMNRQEQQAAPAQGMEMR